MKPESPRTPNDNDINRLLRRGYRDTSPEFEARWVALKRELRQEPRSRPFWSAPWAGWLGVIGAVAALAFVAYVRQPVPPPVAEVPGLSPQLAELFSMDSVLTRAAPLLDEENRTALLHLPASVPPQS